MKNTPVLFIALVLLIGGCAKQPATQDDKSHGKKLTTLIDTVYTDSFFVNLEIATAVAQRITNEVFTQQEYNGAIRDIASSYPVFDENGKPALYVFNYGDDGYVILSADYRYQPVCAFGEHSSIEQTGDIPSMLISWFGRTVGNIAYLRDGNDPKNDYAPYGIAGWQTLGPIIHLEIKPPIVFDPCAANFPPPVTVKEPLMATTWGQDCEGDFNAYCPNMSCNPLTANCNKAVTGCVATALGQIVRYWSHPGPVYTYNFNTMPGNYANDDAARLLHDAGMSVSMNYGCNKSDAPTTNIPQALKYTFGFPGTDPLTGNTGRINNYEFSSREIVINNINAGWPVLLTGCTTAGNIHHLAFWTWGEPASDCHLWVCDGYKTEKYPCYKNVFYHMNWGWRGKADGFYFQSNWAPTYNQQNNMPPFADYQYADQYVYDIHL